MLKIVIALALVLGSVECAAACTPVASAQPPCHHHKQAPACSHELVPATIVPSFVIDPPLPSEAVNPQTDARILISFVTSSNEDPSPPGLNVPPFAVLRI
jgi:hypothetical protein